MSVLFLQFGDVEEALRRFARGEPENYREQRHSVEAVRQIARDRPVCVVSLCERDYDQRPESNLRLIGARRAQAESLSWLRGLFAEVKPSRFILRAPLPRAALWARLSGAATLPHFADQFPGGTGLRRRLVNRAWRSLLSGPNTPCASNHSLNASRSLVEVVGLDPRRVVPWDRAPLEPDPEPKPAPDSDGPFRLFYVGLLSEPKGVSDMLEAMARLRAEGRPVEAEFVGDEPEPWRSRAAEMGLGEAARFPGRLPNAQVRARMRAADAVVVPSRHSYAEGLPNSLIEGLASRTPVIASDHPSFASRLETERQALLFRGGDPEALATTIRRLADGSELYCRLSLEGASALPQLAFGLHWSRLWELFLDDPRDERGWVAANSLDALRGAV